MDLNLDRIYTIRKNLRDLYSTMSLIVFVLLLSGTLIGIDASDRKCTLIPTDDERSLAYACVQADLNDLEELPSVAEWIEFSVSRFPRIPADAFSRFSHLRRLAFYNCDIRDIDPAAFRGLNDLEWLILYNSKIGVVRASWFRHLPNLRRLVLDRNELVYVEPEAFSGLARLTSLSLRDNDLNCLPIDLLSDLPRLKTVQIGRNPWLCDCRKDLNLFFERRAIDAGPEGRSSYSRRNECMTEVKLTRNQMTSFLATTSQRGGTILASSGGVGSSFSSLTRLEDATQWIRITDININRIPSYAFFRFGNSLRSLEFLNCNITEIEADAFAGLAKLERLVLVGNYLNVIRASWFRDLVNLQILILDADRIDDIDNGAFLSLGKLRHLSLHRNKLQCLSINELRNLVQLERINVASNPWNCNCQAVLKNYLASNRIGYEINDFRCDSRPLQPNEFKESDKIIEWHETHESHQTHKETLMNTTSVLTLEPVTETTTGVQTKQVTPPLNFHHERRVGEGFCISRQRADDLPASKFPYTCHQATLAHANVIPSTVDALVFSSSYIPTVTRSSFARFGENLKILKLANCRTKNIEPGALVDLIGLETLIIQDNDLETVRESWFQGLYNLRHLSLTGNKITRIENGVFSRIPNLVTLEIDNNRMNCIGLNFLESLRYLRFMRIAGNPWTCLCRLSLVQFLEERGISYERHVFHDEIHADETECFGNSSLRLRPTKPSATTVTTTIVMPTPPPLSLIRPTDPIVPNHYATVSTKKGQCAYEEDVEPGQIINYKCTFGDLSVLRQIPSDAESIELHEVYIPHLPPRAFSRFQNLTKLVIRNCGLREVDPRAFEDLFRLQVLTIDDNRLATIDSSWFRDTSQLRNLSVTRNSLTEIAPDAFRNLAGSLEYLSLQDNDLTCIYTSILADLRRLKNMEFGRNKLKWRCWEELSQYLESRHVNYTKMPNPCNSKKLVWDLFGQKSEKLVTSSASLTCFFKFLTIGLIFLVRCF